MILDRKTFYILTGRIEEAVTLLKADLERINRTNTVRLSRSITGRYDLLAVEWEFESLREYEEFWAEISRTPEFTASMKKWNELQEKGYSQDLWELIE